MTYSSRFVDKGKCGADCAARALRDDELAADALREPVVDARVLAFGARRGGGERGELGVLRDGVFAVFCVDE